MLYDNVTCRQSVLLPSIEGIAASTLLFSYYQRGTSDMGASENRTVDDVSEVTSYRVPDNNVDEGCQKQMKLSDWLGIMPEKNEAF